MPLPFDEKELVVKEATMPVLEPGTLIRVIREPNGFGKIAKVTGLPEELTKVESETLVRVLEAVRGRQQDDPAPRQRGSDRDLIEILYQP